MQIYQGIDIVSVRRIQEITEKQGNAFLRRVFKPAERRYCIPRKRKFEHLAARFAAKEAFIKAVSSLTDFSIPLNEIEIMRRPSGKPFIRIKASLLKKMNLPSGFRTDLSISHEREYAVASVIVSVEDFFPRSKKVLSA